MKIFTNKSKTVFVATGKGDGCPRASVSKKSVKFRDDYYGVISTRKRIVSRLFGNI